MIVKYSPQAANGVSTLMSVGDLPSFSSAQKTLAVGAGVGLLAALVLGSKRKILFALVGAGANYMRVRRRAPMPTKTVVEESNAGEDAWGNNYSYGSSFNW